MGWRELRAWVRQMNQERSGPPGDPGRLDDPASRRNWAEMAAKRDRMMGRATR
jgi:hypothetical protein